VIASGLTVADAGQCSDFRGKTRPSRGGRAGGFLFYSCRSFAASNEEPANAETVPSTGGSCLGEGGCLSAAMCSALESVP
jgi:hypothetical protein